MRSTLRTTSEKKTFLILSREANCHNRGIKESVYIRGFSPTLNRIEGRHQHPHYYDSIIQKIVNKTESPVTHKPSEQRLITTKRPPGRPRINQEASQTDPKTTPTNITRVASKTAPKVAPTNITQEPTIGVWEGSSETSRDVPIFGLK